MMRNFQAEALQEATQSAAFKKWVELRVDNIHHKVSAEDVLARNGFRLKYGGHRPEQLSCPFHGKDNKPSARFFPSVDKPACVWCYVCKERWDAITLWKKFAQFEGPFTRLLHEIEKAYSLDVPDAPSRAVSFEEDTDESEEIAQLFDVCERRLKGAKPVFSMSSFLTIASILDRLRFQLDARRLSTNVARTTLRQVLDKIGEKERNTTFSP